MLDARQATQVTDGLAVIGVLSQVLAIRRVFDARRDFQVLGNLELIFDEWLQDSGLEALMEIRQYRVDPGPWIGRNLVAIGIGVFRPQAGAQDAETGFLAQAQQVAVGAVAVELVGGAGGRDGGAVVVLLIMISVGVELVVQLPAAAEVRGQAGIFEV